METKLELLVCVVDLDVVIVSDLDLRGGGGPDGVRNVIRLQSKHYYDRCKITVQSECSACYFFSFMLHNLRCIIDGSILDTLLTPAFIHFVFILWLISE